MTTVITGALAKKIYTVIHFGTQTFFFFPPPNGAHTETTAERLFENKMLLFSSGPKWSFTVLSQTFIQLNMISFIKCVLHC